MQIKAFGKELQFWIIALVGLLSIFIPTTLVIAIWYTVISSAISQAGVTPTTTPSPIPPRTLGTSYNFPWQERWRIVTHLFGFYHNVRNLIAVKDGVIFTDNLTGRADWLKFVNANNGNLQWAVEFDSVIDSITADENLVYVGGYHVNGKPGQSIGAYDLKTGELIWKSDTPLPDHTGYVLQLQAKNLYAYAYPPNLTYIFDTRTGKLVDQVSVLGIGEKSFLLLQLNNKDALYSSEDELLVMSRDDKVVWRTDLDVYLLQKLPDIYEQMLVIRFEEPNTLFDSLAGVELNTGKIIWRRSGEFYSNFVIVDNLLYVISKKAEILVLDPNKGQTISRAELLPNKVDMIHPVSAVAANEEMLYVYFLDSEELIAFEKVR